VNAAVASTLRASSVVDGFAVRESPASYGLPGVSHQPKGDKKAGVVWHTQGSGKSLSMLFYTGKIVLALDNPVMALCNEYKFILMSLITILISAKKTLKSS
jgi:type I restriction enzyme R subunit